MFGHLAPYDKPWPSSGNDVILEARGDVLIAGQPIQAGRYVLSLVPRITEPWTVTLKRLPGQVEGDRFLDARGNDRHARGNRGTTRVLLRLRA